MPNGVDLPHETVSEDVVREVTGDYDLPENVPCCLFIGRLMWYKGLRIILDALARLHAGGLDFRMVFVGGGGDEAEVREYTARLGLEKKVVFTGAISNRKHLRAWYTRADLFLFPSTFDTNGLVVREAAASNTAAVIIDGSCASEGVTKDRNGFLIEESAAALASKLAELFAYPDTMKKVGINAGNELYISWEDAVAHAYDRYEVVIDRYNSGKYSFHDPVRGSWMQSQGEMMQILGDIGAAGKTIRQDVEDFNREMDMNLRSIRNKALTDVITTTYEAQQGFEAKKKELKEGILSVGRQIKETGDELWEHLERYL